MRATGLMTKQIQTLSTKHGPTIWRPQIIKNHKIVSVLRFHEQSLKSKISSVDLINARYSPIGECLLRAIEMLDTRHFHICGCLMRSVDMLDTRHFSFGLFG